MTRPDYRKFNKAYRAIVRDTLTHNTNSAEFEHADKMFVMLKCKTISKTDFDYYVQREEEYRSLNQE